MAENVIQGTSSKAGYCNSKRCTAGAARVVHISNPTIMVKTTASEFCAVVQSLTGQKRPPPSSIQHQEINYLYSDDRYSSPQVKAPKLVDELQCFNGMKPSESAIMDENITVSDRDHGDDSISEKFEVRPIQNPDYSISEKFEVRPIQNPGYSISEKFDAWPIQNPDYSISEKFEARPIQNPDYSISENFEVRPIQNPDYSISEKFEVRPIQNPDYIFSKYQVFEIGVRDTRRTVF